jgi:hypothetical protein
MVTEISALEEDQIGEVFTPIEWAKWLIRRWGVFERWISGATICDPTAGEGAFALALLSEAQNRGITVTQELISKIVLIEIRQKNLDTYKKLVLENYGLIVPPESVLCLDVVRQTPPVSFDILIGNPPWANFNDLPHDYKEMLKPHFVAEGLVPDGKAVLLGSSRTDLAALVLQVVIGKLLNDKGEGYFFLPLSLFTGNDAHRGFREYSANGVPFSITEVFEFNESKVFEGVGTSYGCACFNKGTNQEFPVRYWQESHGKWIENRAYPLREPTDQWRVLNEGEEILFDSGITVHLSPEQKPRQGINTCGANDVFIFNEFPDFLPAEYLYPLATKEIWKHKKENPVKWILLPYDKANGRPLREDEIRRHPSMWNYFLNHVDKLKGRKGVLIQSQITKGAWWSLMGVGPYSFSPYKVIWQSYGQSNFDPVVLSSIEGQVWQGNQAMNAFIPCGSVESARTIQAGLSNPSILLLLKQLNGSGKCNWAQPGKIKKILSFNSAVHEQVALL